MNRIVHHQATMTSREVADLTGSPHDAVLKTIRKLIAEGVVSGNETPYKHLQNGQTYSEFLLSFRDTMVVVSGYSAELRAKIIDRWQELEAGAAPAGRVTPPKAPIMVAAGMAPALVRALRSFGIDQNAAAISANQIISAETGVNLLQRAGHTHLVTPTQEICYTPTELGHRRCVNARTFNRSLADAGLQVRVGEHWVPTEKGKPHAVVLDTGKQHSNGTPVQQVKWLDSVLDEVHS
jgi:hypothetical protein